MRADQRRHLHERDLRIAEILRRRLLRPFQQFLAIEDLEQAAAVGAVGHVDAVALRAGRHHAVDGDRDRTGRAGLLSGQSEVADLDRIGRVAEVEDFDDARAPALRPGDDVGDAAGLAFPIVLVGVGHPEMAPQHLRLGRIGDLPHLVALTPEGAQQVDPVGIALAERLAVADARHLRRAGLAVTDRARNVPEIFRLLGIGHVEDRRPVELVLPGDGVARRRVLLAAAVVTDIGDVAPALLEDGRLVGGARLEIIVTDEPHVQRLGRIADLGCLRPGLRQRRDGQQSNDSSGGCRAQQGTAGKAAYAVHAGISFELQPGAAGVTSGPRRYARRRSAPECEGRCWRGRRRRCSRDRRSRRCCSGSRPCSGPCRPP